MFVPLTARGKTFGAMVFMAAPGRQYASDDLLLAEELTRRAALAIDNARLYEQAQTAIRTREEVLAVVSHDLRPLGTIQRGRRHLRATRERAASGDDQDRREDRRASDRMIHMISDLLDFSSIEAGPLRIEVADQDAGELVAEAVETYQPSRPRRGFASKSSGAVPPEGPVRSRPDRAGLLEPDRQCDQVPGRGRLRHRFGAGAKATGPSSASATRAPGFPKRT